MSLKPRQPVREVAHPHRQGTVWFTQGKGPDAKVWVKFGNTAPVSFKEAELEVR